MKNKATRATRNSLKIVGLLFLLTLSLKAYATEIAGVSFNETYVDNGINMALQGTGLKHLLFFKAFAAGFYKGEGSDSDVLGNYPKRIEVQYFVNIPGKKLNDFTLDTMKHNVSVEGMNNLKEELVLMSRYFVDLKPGDRFSLTYIPQVGTKFALNGQLVGIIKGEAFAKALFSVWIGQKPFDNNLKQEVLGLNRADKPRGIKT